MSEAPAILLVDDDRLVLRSMKRALGRARGTWEIDTEPRPASALSRLRKKSYDIVISDLDMPEIDGAELLRNVQKTHPAVVRIAFTGSRDAKQHLRLVGPAHQYLRKPLAPQALLETLERALALRDHLQSPLVAGIVSRKNALPMLSSTYVRLVDAIEREDIDEAVSCAQSDPALAARVMQLASSALFGRLVAPKDLRSAVMVIGVNTLRALVLEQAVVTRLAPSISTICVDDIQSQGMMAGILAREAMRGTELRDLAFIAGLLHGVGHIVLAARAPKLYRRARQVAARDEMSLSEALLATLDVTEAEVGAYLLGLWGLPETVVDVIANQNNPPRQGTEGELDLRLAVYVAVRLARDPSVALRDGAGASADLDQEVIARTHFARELESLRQRAERLHGHTDAA
ncbi:MAG: HDOD domain-containing protein [Myxococcota bacterium]